MTETISTEQVVTELRKVLAENTGCAMTHYNLGIALVKLRQWDDAALEFVAAIAESPELAEAYINLSGICFQKGEMEKGIDLCRRVIAFRPDYAIPYGNIGFAYLQMGEIDQAVEMLEKAVQKDPKFVQALSDLGSAYLMQGKIEESVTRSKKAIEIAPRFAVAHNNLAVAYHQMGDSARAMAHCEKASAYGYEVHPKFLEELAALQNSVGQG
jgi:tetratricopeptide (TPR) repeat protein